MDGDGQADLMPSYVSGVTADGDSAAVVFNPDDGIASNWSDDFVFNGTALVELGPLNLRFSSVYEKSEWMSNTLPIYAMFNSERLPERNTTKSVFTARANYFINSNILATFGYSRLNRDYASFDHLFGAPNDITDVLGWGDSLKIAEAGGDASFWKSRYDDPNDYYLNQFGFSRPGDLVTSSTKNNRKTNGIDLGLTIQKNDHEFRIGYDQQQLSEE